MKAAANWNWIDEVANSISRVAPPAKAKAPKPLSTEPEEKTPEEKARALVIQNPAMNAATTLNALKNAGLTVTATTPQATPQKKAKSEADSGSSNVAALRAKTRESGAINFRCRLVESSYKDNSVGATRFRAILIQEGLGNFGDSYFYTRSALESAVQLFEGKKIFADHPSLMDEKIRPERSVRDIIGHYENLKLEESEGGQAILTADVVVLPDEPYRWARALMVHAVEFAKKYPDKDFVGLSINASGDAERLPVEEFLKTYPMPEGAKPKFDKALAGGINEVKVVKSFTEAISTDLVTEAGAGGRILQMLEMEKKSMSTEKQKEAEEKATREAEEKAKHEAEEKAKEGDEADTAKGGDAAHDDEQKDVELIKKMLKDHCGDEAAESEEACKAAHETYKGYKEMGMEAEEALKHAGAAMKLAKHKAGKKAEGEEKKPEGEEKKPEGEEKAPAKPADKKESEEAEESCEGCKHKESELAKLKGENAKLKEGAAKIELAEHLDKKLRESKHSRKVTDAFRELTKEAKTKGEVDKLWESFRKGIESAEVKTSLDGLFVMTEKNTAPSTNSEAVGFGDCVKR